MLADGAHFSNANSRRRKICRCINRLQLDSVNPIVSTSGTTEGPTQDILTGMRPNHPSVGHQTMASPVVLSCIVIANHRLLPEVEESCGNRQSKSSAETHIRVGPQVHAKNNAIFPGKRRVEPPRKKSVGNASPLRRRNCA
jgi:hypothetical protein